MGPQKPPEATSDDLTFNNFYIPKEYIHVVFILYYNRIMTILIYDKWYYP